MKTIVVGIVLVLTVFSCTSNIEQSEEEQKKIMFKNSKNEVLSSLTQKYEIKFLWDTLDYEYTIEYKPVIASNFQLIDNFDIHDIYDSDSSMFVTITTSYYPTFYFDFPITNAQRTILCEDKKDLILVVNIEGLKKLKLVPECDVDSDYASLYFYSADDFIGRGKIIYIESLNKP